MKYFRYGLNLRRQFYSNYKNTILNMKSQHKYYTQYLGIFTLMALLALGCKKDKDDSALDTDTSSATENAAMEAAFDDVSGIADEAADGSVSSYRDPSVQKVMTSCAVVTLDTAVLPYRITIDFGNSNCLGNDGNYRRGKIYIDFIGGYRDSGSTHTVSFDNYFVNDNQLTGTKMVTNNGRNAAGHLSYTIVVNGSVLWSAGFGGGTSSLSSTRTRTWVSGESTLPWTDDIYRISGSSSGTTRNGTSYTLQITSPLKKEIGFRHFTEGVVDFVPGSLATRTIDFSYVNGAQDNLARVTINGVTFTIML